MAIRENQHGCPPPTSLSWSTDTQNSSPCLCLFICLQSLNWCSKLQTLDQFPHDSTFRCDRAYLYTTSDFNMDGPIKNVCTSLKHLVHTIKLRHWSIPSNHARILLAYHGLHFYIAWAHDGRLLPSNHEPRQRDDPQAHSDGTKGQP